MIKINVKGSFNLTQALLPSRNPNATVISVNAGSVQIPGAFSHGYSAYNSSKMAVAKFFEILAVENPDVHVVTMHPGVGKSKTSSCSTANMRVNVVFAKSRQN